MFRVIVLFLICMTSSFATLLKSVEYLEVENKNVDFKQVINSKKFKKIELPFSKKTDNDYFFRLTFNKKAIKNNTKVLKIESIAGELRVENNLVVIEDNEHTKYIYLSEKVFTEELYIKIDNEKDFINLDISSHELRSFLKENSLESKLFGFAYGIIFAAFLYYFALYVFNREKSYIYYSLTQLSILLILVANSNNLLDEDGIAEHLLFLSFFLFSNFFTKSFLNTKILSPKSHFLLNTIIVIYFLVQIYEEIFNLDFFGEDVPISSLLIFYLFAAVSVYMKGYKPALYYLFGWGVVIGSIFFIEVQTSFIHVDSLINPKYVLHLSIPLESLILAFALSYKMKVSQEEKEEQQHFLAHQSKLASMGEMIGNIAHQWRQPLTHLSYTMMNIKAAFEKDKLSKEFFEQRNKEATLQLNYMSQTINDFINFFKVTKEKELFSVNEAIDEVLSLLNQSFKANEIQVEFNSFENYEIKSFKGEFLQVLFNLLNNAKDELLKHKIQDAKIQIVLKKEKQKIYLEVIDNASGIKEELLEKIFEPYFTTKDKGLGIGLYMSKMIVEKNMNGKLEVYNLKQGACFRLIL